MGRRAVWAEAGLLLITLMWGTTFILMKKATGNFPPLAFLSWRYAVAALVTVPFLWQVRRKLLGRGLLVGGVLWLGMALQLLGLRYVSAGEAAFITGLSVVMVPFLEALLAKRTLGLGTYLAAAAAAAGLLLLVGAAAFGFNFGALLEFAGAICFALQIFLTGALSLESPMALTGLEMMAGFILGAVFGIFPVRTPTSPTFDVIAYTALFGSAGAVILQSYLQRFAPPSRTALIFTFEPVFAALFAWWWGGEILKGWSLVGAALIFLSLLLAEVGPKRGALAGGAALPGNQGG